MIRCVSLLLLLMAMPLTALAQDETKTDLTPHIHGAFRARYEHTTSGEALNRFQLRNARVTLDGAVAPGITYFLQTDLCDRGTMRFLDGWGRIAFSRSVALQAGQFRLPFGTDCFKAPANYIFANRSFVGKEMNNVRGVGAKLSGSLSAVTLEAGAFNLSGISDHTRWTRTLAYAGKAQVSMKNLRLAAGVQSIEPDSVRINLLGASATWTSGRWTAEAEYINKHYTHGAHKPSHGYNVWADYRMPVHAGIFNQASFQVRVDGMSDHSSGLRDASGHLITNHPGRDRITAGATLSYVHTPVRCDLRIGYEHYFYRHSSPSSPDASSRICAEMVVRF